VVVIEERWSEGLVLSWIEQTGNKRSCEGCSVRKIVLAKRMSIVFEVIAEASGCRIVVVRKVEGADKAPRSARMEGQLVVVMDGFE